MSNRGSRAAHTEACWIRMGRGNFSCSCEDVLQPITHAALTVAEQAQLAEIDKTMADPLWAGQPPKQLVELRAIVRRIVEGV